MDAKTQLLIEREVTEAFTFLSDRVGFARADLMFSEAGLNSDDTWEGKRVEAWELVREYIQQRAA